MFVVLINGLGSIKRVKLGYSWTMLFFGKWVPLLRGDFKWLLVIFLLQVLLAHTSFFYYNSWVLGFTANNTVTFIFSFIYNRLYAKDLVRAGYYGITPEEDALVLNYIR